jgi:hypothetical protein
MKLFLKYIDNHFFCRIKAFQTGVHSFVTDPTEELNIRFAKPLFIFRNRVHRFDFSCQKPFRAVSDNIFVQHSEFKPEARVPAGEKTVIFVSGGNTRFEQSTFATKH